MRPVTSTLPVMPNHAIFGSLERMVELRRRLRPHLDVNRIQNSGRIAESAGWRCVELDSQKMMNLVPGLSLEDGWELCGSVFRVNRGRHAVVGHGIVHAVPCAERELIRYDHGTPFAPDHRPVMDRIRGNGQPSTYLDTSILWRELNEFGASQHHLSWWTHQCVDTLPTGPWSFLKVDHQPETFEVPNWTVDRIDANFDIRPRIELADGLFVVTFFTVSPRGKVGLYVHRDCYRQGGYQLIDTFNQCVATADRSDSVPAMR